MNATDAVQVKSAATHTLERAAEELRKQDYVTTAEFFGAAYNAIKWGRDHLTCCPHRLLDEIENELERRRSGVPR